MLILAGALFLLLHNQQVNAARNYFTGNEANLYNQAALLQDNNVNGNDYYVSSAGNDLNNGLSPESPWRTVSKVNSFILSPGDRVFFRRGDEWKESLLVDESGTYGAMITFGAYGTGEKPVFNQADFIKGWSYVGYNVWTAICPVFDNSNGIPHDYVALFNGDLLTQVGTLTAVITPGSYFIDTSPAPDRIYIYSTTDPDNGLVEVSARKFGVGVLDQTYIRIQNLDFRNAGHSGAFFHAATENGQIKGNCIIEGCDFSRNRISGIIFDNGYSDNLVQNCRSTYNGNGFYCSSYLSWGSDRNTFSNCYSASNINYTAGVVSDGHGYGIWNSDDNIVEHCESYNDQYGINIDPNDRKNDITIKYNYVHDTKQGTPGINAGGNIPAGTIHYVYGNVVVNPGAGGDGYAIWIFGTSRQGSVFVYNNTIYLDGSSNHSNFALYSTAGTNVTIKNNIVYSNSDNTTLLNVNGGASFICDNNLYFAPADQTNILRYNGRNYHTLTSWQTATGWDINSKYGDPLFVNNTSEWIPRPGSPAIDSGDEVGITYDFLKNPIIGTPDIGAFEYQATPVVPIPVHLSSSVENNSPSITEMNYSLNLANIVPAASAFTVRVNSTSRPVSSVAISGTKVLLTLSSPVAYGDVVTVAYAKPSSNPIQTPAGGQAAALTTQNVVNRVAAPDVPVFVSASVENAAPARIEMVYSMTLANIVPAASAFTIRVNSTSRPVSSVAISGTRVLLTLSSPVAYGDVVTVAYAKPSSNPIQTPAGGQAAAMTNQNVVNRIAAPDAPVFVSASVENAAPARIEMVYSMTLANIVPAASAFTVRVNSTSRPVSSVAISGTRVLLSLASPVAYGDVVTVAYTKPSSNPVQTPAGGQVATHTNQNVVNRVALTNKVPIVVLNYNNSCYSGFVNSISADESYDENNDLLTFTWETPSNLAVSSKNESTLKFLAPVVNSPTIIDFKVTVSDGKTTQSEFASVEVLPYKPEMESAVIADVDASSFLSPDHPFNIIDGDFSTSWSASGSDQWLIVELKRPFRIMHITLSFKPDLNVKMYFEIHGSNDRINWEPIITKTESCGFSWESQVFDVPPSKAGKEFRFIKFIGAGNTEDSYSSISEMTVFGFIDDAFSSYDNSLVKIFPNPAREYINIRIDAPFLKSNTIQIFDISRRLLLSIQTDPDQREFHIPINMKSGIYLLQLKDSNKVLSTSKIIIMN